MPSQPPSFGSLSHGSTPSNTANEKSQTQVSACKDVVIAPDSLIKICSTQTAFTLMIRDLLFRGAPGVEAGIDYSFFFFLETSPPNLT
ncbi:hypothetical protein HZS61_000649 [Fusarium oxysporum f. sp. conglutinans]|uniref:Uncharacterized protein n=1 Tax=Fusarium oxysporum f. sp. conglutinans TaxID=100902 RepID=A0A8H6LQ65_FUSOX|nr:hypothetical protein HZS61_000649 [Fusarium oxysporum f. sp. conglutinans]